MAEDCVDNLLGLDEVPQPSVEVLQAAIRLQELRIKNGLQTSLDEAIAQVTKVRTTPPWSPWAEGIDDFLPATGDGKMK